MDDDGRVIEFYENRCAVCYAPMRQVKGGRLRRTCSAACRQKLYRMRKKAVKKERQAAKAPAKHPKGTCPVCGKPLVQPPTGRKRKTCSDRCRKRLWRRQHPRCLVCGKHFTMARYQKNQKYCSKYCRWRANQMMKQQARREKAWREAAVHRPDWKPRRGTGYRAERISWEAGEEREAVLWERKPQPRYEATPEEKEAQEARRKAEEAEAETAWRAAAYREAMRQKRETERITYDLLFDESKWRDW